MNLEETLDKIVELSREELGLVRKRGEEKTAAREHAARTFTRCSAPPTGWTITPTSSAGCTTPNSARTGGTRAWRTRPGPPERGQRSYVGRSPANPGKPT